MFVFVLMVLIFLELSLAFIFFPLRKGLNFYSLIYKEYAIAFRFDPINGFRLRENLIYQNPTPPIKNAPRRVMFVDVRTDKNGFLFLDDISKLDPKFKLVFCMGGSTTMGSESHSNKTFPAVLDGLLKSNNFRCINASVGGYRSIHELICFKTRILPFNPAAVIVFSGYNDYEDFVENSFEAKNPFRHCHSSSLPTTRLGNYLRFSALLFFCKRLLYKLMGRIRKETISSPVGLEKYQIALKNLTWLKEWVSNIEEMIDICKKNNVKIFLLTHMSPVYENAPPKAKEFADVDLNMNGRFDSFVGYIRIMDKAIKNICLEKKAGLLNVGDDFNNYLREKNLSEKDYYKKRFSFFVDRMHFTEEGNELLASFIFKRIKDQL